jgi:uncharacterized NAD(P)/FAD-binding protein YdhS
MKRTIAIIGAGFSGTLTAVNILRTNSSNNLRVLLIESASKFGRGLAYRFYDDNLLLNVPAGNMSALADEPNHFVSYCQHIDPAFNAKSFLSRRLYGEYLEHTLSEAESKHPQVLERVSGEAVALHRTLSNKAFRVELANGIHWEAQQVVLALGHFPPSSPKSLPENLHKYVIDPWHFDAIDRLDPNKPIAILGSGLTGIDVLFRLTSYNTTRKIFLLSRRGLLPHAHRFNPQPPGIADYPTYFVGVSQTVRAYTSAVRSEVMKRETSGGDWRDVINEIRPHTSHIWQSLPTAEQYRFLKQIAPYWDIHRHRLAPSAGRRLEYLLASDQVERKAGYVINAGMKGGNIRIDFRERNSGSIVNLEVSAVINCSSPNYNLSTISQPLITQLRTTGLIQTDALKLGLLMDDKYQVINTNNQPTHGLFYVGPMLKAKYWEAIAVPELRVHTKNLARHLVSL